MREAPSERCPVELTDGACGAPTRRGGVSIRTGRPPAARSAAVEARSPVAARCGAAGCVVLALVVGLQAWAKSAVRHVVHGELVLDRGSDYLLGTAAQLRASHGENFIEAADAGMVDAPCYEYSDGYSDIADGTSATVSDESGKILAVGRLEGGEYLLLIGGPTGCRFEFTVEVPRADVYRFEVGARGQLDYSYSELRERAFLLSFDLGG